MSANAARGPGFWRTLYALLRAARVRSRGRLTRQAQLRGAKGASAIAALPVLGFVVLVLFGGMIQMLAAFGLASAFETRHGVVYPGADAVGLFLLLFWVALLVCQGEGPDLDTRRQRHPMWEWLLSHPAPPSAVFIAEMLTPIAANPVLLCAPLYPALLFGWVHGAPVGFAAAVLVGVPATLALAFLGKAIEINLILRFAPRSRGAILGLMGWFGYTGSLGLMLLASQIHVIMVALASPLAAMSWLPWPHPRELVGIAASGDISASRGMLYCILIALAVAAFSIELAIWGARGGLAGATGSASPVGKSSRVANFGKEPLYRKELLWFRRDGGAIVQVVLIPLSLASVQLFNFRGLLVQAGSSWTSICGVALLFGTYFLLILGPKSLASEGSALWIALTWPRGLESLLKAKARLWSLVATGFVTLILAYAVYLFPGDIWRIALVAMGWYLFARTLAEKAVTLATVTSSSGEPTKVPGSHRLAATLGTLTFAVGVLSEQWGVAIAGIVYSQMTAAALWQNFRYRLPYLYDPWSEKLPPPPTLMHAMIGVSAMVEGVSILNAVALVWFGAANAAVSIALIYGLCAIVTSLTMAIFLDGRGVPARDVWLWSSADRPRIPFLESDLAGKGRVIILIALAAMLGVALGFLARGYVSLLDMQPYIHEFIEAARRRMAESPNARASYYVMAVLFAPFAEEYLFRALLYRALDREWGGWRAVVGAAAFFAIYHPVLSWAPVAAVGAVNAILFKRTGRLAPAIALHMAYNATVLF